MRAWGALLTFLILLGSAAAQEPTLRELRAILDERDAKYNQRFEAQEKAVSAALAAAKEAVLKAETASEKRFESVNEFRTTLKDQQLLLITRSEAGAQFKALSDRLDSIDARQIALNGRLEGITWVWGIMVAGGGVVVGAIGIFLRVFPRKGLAR